MSWSRVTLVVSLAFVGACSDDAAVSQHEGLGAEGGNATANNGGVGAVSGSDGGNPTGAGGRFSTGRGGASGSSSGGKSTAGARSGGAGGEGSSGGGLLLPTDASGFTALSPSPDTVQIYVSSSTGNDMNDGRSPERAVKTVDRGVQLLRNGQPDWLLFKRGDTWTTGLGSWDLSGRSETERMVIGAFGEGERPRFEFRGEALMAHRDSGSSETVGNLVFTSLHFLGSRHDPSKGTPTGPSPVCVSWLRGGHDVLFEDMSFEYCQVNVMFTDRIPAERFRFHRCVFSDSFSMDQSHAQAIFLHGVKSMSLEENVFDRCGWHPDFREADPTVFNHCIYWQSGSAGDGVVRGNVIMRAASHGAQMRSSGRVEGNVFARNAIGGFLAADFEPEPTGIQGTLIGNLFTEGEDTTPREGHPGDDYRGWGWDIVDNPPRDAIIRDNLFAHCLGTACRSVARVDPPNVMQDNLVWNWRSSGSEFLPNAKGPFKEPDRTLASYNASLGGEESFEAFAAEIRKQSKTNWRPAYSAQKIIEYFRDGLSGQ